MAILSLSSSGTANSNGVDEIIINAAFMNDGGEAEQGVVVSFFAGGNARFSNGENYISATTGSEGIAQATLTNTTAEQVLVSAVDMNTLASSAIMVTFTQGCMYQIISTEVISDEQIVAVTISPALEQGVYAYIYENAATPPDGRPIGSTDGTPTNIINIPFGNLSEIPGDRYYLRVISTLSNEIYCEIEIVDEGFLSIIKNRATLCDIQPVNSSSLVITGRSTPGNMVSLYYSYGDFTPVPEEVFIGDAITDVSGEFNIILSESLLPRRLYILRTHSPFSALEEGFIVETSYLSEELILNNNFINGLQNWSTFNAQQAFSQGDGYGNFSAVIVGAGMLALQYLQLDNTLVYTMRCEVRVNSISAGLFYLGHLWGISAPGSSYTEMALTAADIGSWRTLEFQVAPQSVGSPVGFGFTTDDINDLDIRNISIVANA
jgi:hypothetical protein